MSDEVTSKNHQQIASRFMSDQKITIYGNKCIILFFYMLFYVLNTQFR